MISYFNKWGLTTNGLPEEQSPKRLQLTTILFSGLFSFIGIFIIVLIEHQTDFLLVIASFGASAVLLYDSIGSPLAQPKNVFGGHIISSIIGVSTYKLANIYNGKFHYLPVSAGLAIGLSVILMGITKISLLQ